MMKVRILRSFGSTVFGHRSEGMVCDLPEGADWIEAGLAEPVAPVKKARKRKATAPRKRKAMQKKAEGN